MAHANVDRLMSAGWDLEECLKEKKPNIMTD